MEQLLYCLKPRALMLLLLFAALSFGQVPVIFDTDMGNDIDDALALSMLHSLSSRGECRLIGVTLTNANPSAVPYVQLVNRFYGHSAIPIGFASREVEDGSHDNYLSAALRSAPVAYRERDPNAVAAIPAVKLLRRLLATSRDKVAIIQVGFSTNLAALLDSQGDEISPENGATLVVRKVSMLAVMAGNFAKPEPEYNVKLDVLGAKTVFEGWPTPILFSGFEIGQELLFPARSIEKDFAYTDWHPIAVSYRAYKGMPYDRPTWDLTAVLAAVRPDHAYFDMSPEGRVQVTNNGTTRFSGGLSGHRYLILNPAKRTEILEVLALLTSEPPHTATLRK